MKSRAQNRRASRRVWVSTLLLVMAVATNACADWQADVELYLTGMTDYVQKDQTLATYNFVASTAELTISSRDRPYYASLFADYRFSTNGDLPDIVNLGGYVKYIMRRWDATTYLFVNKTSRTEDAWYYVGRLRYRVAENHKVGVFTTGSLAYPGSLDFAFGYFGSISDSLSLNVVADPGINKGPDFAAHMELVWQVH